MTREITSDSVKNRLSAKEFNFWRKLMPSLLDAFGVKKKKYTEGFCEKEGDCSP